MSRSHRKGHRPDPRLRPDLPLMLIDTESYPYTTVREAGAPVSKAVRDGNLIHRALAKQWSFGMPARYADNDMKVTLDIMKKLQGVYHKPQPEGWNKQVVERTDHVNCRLKGHPITQVAFNEHSPIVSQHARYTICGRQIHVFTPRYGDEAVVTCLVCIAEGYE